MILQHIFSIPLNSRADPSHGTHSLGCPSAWDERTLRVKPTHMENREQQYSNGRGFIKKTYESICVCNIMFCCLFVNKYKTALIGF